MVSESNMLNVCNAFSQTFQPSTPLSMVTDSTSFLLAKHHGIGFERAAWWWRQWWWWCFSVVLIKPKFCDERKHNDEILTKFRLVGRTTVTMANLW